MRCSSRGEARQTSGAPSAAAGLINRSRDWAESTNQRVVAPRRSLEGCRQREGGSPREEEERPTDVYFCEKKEERTEGQGGGVHEEEEEEVVEEDDAGAR